ncbi:MAG: hypothetical protein ACKO2P_04050 [Planctomycetota bacterium]
MTETSSSGSAAAIPAPQASMEHPERLLILAAVGLLVAAVLQAEPLQSANDRSRWATVWSLVERGTWQIDEIDAQPGWSTIDKVRFRPNAAEPWHFYSSKPPFLSVLTAGLYAVERATLGWGLLAHTAAVTRLLLLIINVLPFALALVALSGTLRMLQVSLAVRCFILAVAGFGSMLNPYLVTLNNHTPAAACAMLAIAAAVQLQLRLRTASAAFVRLGFFAAMTACFELPAAQVGVAACVLAFSVCRRRLLTRFLPAAAVPLALFVASNWAVTGSLKPFYASYGSETYVYTHNGIPSYWSSPRDLDANREPFLTYLFHCLLGHHGLLSLTPVLLLCIPGVFSIWCRQQQQVPAEAPACPREILRQLIAVGGLMTAVTLAFYLTRTENYNYGGNSVALRWMLWLSPFWWLAIAPVLDGAGKRRWGAAGLLLLISIISVQWSQQRPWRPSWLYERMEAAGWINYRTPRAPFDPSRTTLFPRFPDAWGGETFINSRGDRVTLRTKEQPGSTVTRRAFVVEITEARIGGLVLVPSADVPGPVELPALGGPLHPQLPKPETAAGRVAAAVQRMFGWIPAGRPFIASGPMWIPSRSRPGTAWKIERGAVRVAFDDPVHGRCIQRCDAWFCDDLPFGVLQWKLTLTPAASDEVLHTETWTVESY